MIKYILILSILFTSCGRFVTKDYLEENYASKEHVVNVANEISFQEEDRQALVSNLIREEVSKNINSLQKKVEDLQSTTSEVTGSIEPETGVTKSVQIGNTLITSDGVKVDFRTTESKSTNESSTITKEDLKSLETSYSTEISNLKATNREQSTKIESLERKIEEILNSESKKVEKSGLTFWTVFCIILALIVLAGGWYITKFGVPSIIKRK